jgi:hypothetical protein
VLGLSSHSKANDKLDAPAPVTKRSPFDWKLASIEDDVFSIFHATPPGLSVH